MQRFTPTLGRRLVAAPIVLAMEKRRGNEESGLRGDDRFRKNRTSIAEVVSLGRARRHRQEDQRVRTMVLDFGIIGYRKLVAMAVVVKRSQKLT